MVLTVGTVNLNNLFDRFNYDVEIAQLPARDRVVEAAINIVPSPTRKASRAGTSIQRQAHHAQAARRTETKLAQEELIRRSGVPWTIVRATQFHPFVARAFAAGATLGIAPCLKFPMQPVDPREVGGVLAEAAEAEPVLAITQFAGPEVLSGCELARRWRQQTGSHAMPVRLPVTRALRSGGLTNPGARRDSVTFDKWLDSTMVDDGRIVDIDAVRNAGKLRLP